MLLAVNGTVYFLSAIPFIMLGKGDYNHDMVLSKEREVTKFTSLLAVCTFLRELYYFHKVCFDADSLFNSRRCWLQDCSAGLA